MLSCGDTFLIPETSTGVEHLYVVLTEPEPGSNRAVCVNLTSKTVSSDSTVVLQGGDHPFIVRETVVFYQKAKLLDLSTVETALRARMNGIVCKQLEPCDPPVLKRIQDGLLKCKLTPKEVKRYCENVRRVAPAVTQPRVPNPTKLVPPIAPVPPSAS